MVELFKQDIKRNEIHSSKGNQLKWENNGIWYKADFTGYEGLTEYTISHLLKMSSLEPNEYVVYDLEQIKYNTNIYNGVKSANFLKDGWQIITLERLFKNYFGESLNKAIYSMENHKERLRFLVEQVKRITGLSEFGAYMSKLLTIDGLFLNEDRHTHNIAVLMNEEGLFDYCPIFDNGAALLADTTMDYPTTGDTYKLMTSVKAKTICPSFDEQIDIAESLYGVNISLSFKEKDVRHILDNVTEYPEEIKDRVYNIVLAQMRKYGYLFK